jgi:hypothetical protein
LIIGYSTKALRKMAGSKTLPIRTFGREVGEAFHARLADVWAARNVTELPMWEEVSGTGRFTVPLAENATVLFESNHAADRETAEGAVINWQRVTRVKLLEVRSNG